MSLFWPSGGAKVINARKKRRPRRCRQTTQAKTSQSIAKPDESGERHLAHNCSVGVWAMQNDLLATPDDAPSVPVLALPSDMSSVSRAADNVLDMSVDSDEELAVLDRVVYSLVALCSQAEFELDTGPALRYRTTRGMALTPIRMASLSEDGEDSPKDEESTRKYLESCKSVEYVRVDGKPGPTLHRGQCHFWTSIVVTSEVVRTEPN